MTAFTKAIIALSLTDSPRVSRDFQFGVTVQPFIHHTEQTVLNGTAF
jgi:hypothetical protein